MTWRPLSPLVKSYQTKQRQKRETRLTEMAVTMDLLFSRGLSFRTFTAHFPMFMRANK